MFHFLKKNQPKKDATKVVLKIGGMHCTSCAINIDDALEEIEGVIGSNTNYAKSQTVIEYIAEKTDKQELITVIQQVGYEVEEEGE